MEIIDGIARRQRSVARVYLSEGNGDIKVNGRHYKQYFHQVGNQQTIEKPLELTKSNNIYDIKVNVSGGGFRSQAEAIQLAISRALIQAKVDNKQVLKEITKRNIHRRLVLSAKSNSSRLHVTPRENGWAVRKENNRLPYKIFKTKEEAIVYSTNLVQQGKSTGIIVHSRAGTFVRK